MASWVLGSRRRIIRCWPTGRPSVWVSCSSLKVKILVSHEITCLEYKGAVDQARGWRNVGLGSACWSEDASPWARAIFAASLRVPIWYPGIIPFAVSESAGVSAWRRGMSEGNTYVLP